MIWVYPYFRKPPYEHMGINTAFNSQDNENHQHLAISWGIWMGIPFGKHSQFAMENGPFMNDLPSYKMVIFKNGGSFHSYVKLPEGI